MWNYEKRLQFPVNIKETNPEIAKIIITQYGGPDGELSASMRYLAQRYTMPYNAVAGVLTDIGTEELAHFEMICAIVHQLTRDLTPEQIKRIRFRRLLCRSYPSPCGHRQPAVRLSALLHSSPRVILLQICLRIWQLSRRHVPHMIIS